MKNISIIGMVGIPSKYGGFETLTEYLTKNLYNRYSITVFCSAKSYNKKLDSFSEIDQKIVRDWSYCYHLTSKLLNFKASK